MPPPRLPPVGRNLVNQRNKNNTVVSNGGGVPNMITCHVCKKSKPKSQYANRQLQKVADTVHNPYAPAGRSLKDPKTTCMTCTPQQTTELTCVVCDKRKGLEQFAKAQRRHPTKARCKKCVEFHLAHEADDTPPDSDDYAESDSFSDSDDFDAPDGTGNIARGTEKPKVRRAVAAGVTAFGAQDENAHPGYGAYDEDYDDDNGSGVGSRASFAPEDDGGNQWTPVKVAGPGGASAYAAVRGPLPELTAAPPSTASSTHGWSSTTSKKKGGWAKVQKVPKSQEVKWGQTTAQETDEWTTYARELARRREPPKKSGKKKQQRVDPEEIEDDEVW